MAVYVDNFYTTGAGQFGRMKMSHMIADTRKELLAMAYKLGLQKKWIQSYNTTREHFDVSISVRQKAIELGAIEITFRELAHKTSTRIYNGLRPNV